jgi:hypothetical protein
MIKGLIATALLTSAAGAGIATTDLQPPDIYSSLTEAGIELPAIPEKPDRAVIQDLSEEDREVLHDAHVELVTEWLDLLDEEDRVEFEGRIADHEERREAMRAEIEGMTDEEREAFLEERHENRQERGEKHRERDGERSERGEDHEHDHARDGRHSFGQ